MMRKKLTEAMAESLARSYKETNPNIIIRVNDNGREKTLDPAAEILKPFTEKELASMDWTALAVKVLSNLGILDDDTYMVDYKESKEAEILNLEMNCVRQPRSLLKKLFK